MNMALRHLMACAALAALAQAAPAQSDAPASPQAPPGAADTPSSHSSPQSEAGEPRAGASADELRSSAATGETGASRAQAQPAKRTAPAEDGRDARHERKEKDSAVDTLQLKTATVTGDQEQPKVMYIVPWKKSDIGDLSGKPMNSLLDEALAPVDREEFKREVMYYQAVRADASQNGASQGARPRRAGEGEK